MFLNKNREFLRETIERVRRMELGVSGCMEFDESACTEDQNAMLAQPIQVKEVCSV